MIGFEAEKVLIFLLILRNLIRKIKHISKQYNRMIGFEAEKDGFFVCSSNFKKPN
jgi:hypothetical protein